MEVKQYIFKEEQAMTRQDWIWEIYASCAIMAVVSVLLAGATFLPWSLPWAIIKVYCAADIIAVLSCPNYWERHADVFLDDCNETEP